MDGASGSAPPAAPAEDGAPAADPGQAADGYSDEPKPLAEYAATTLVFNALMAAALAAGRDRLPERVGVGDVVLMGVASHKLSRLVAKDRVTSFLRAPFVRYEGEGGPGEVSESPRGTGVRRTLGELLVCPYCLGQWVTAGYATGLLFAPRATRFVGSIFAGLTVSDFLQVAYKAGQERI
ncbi:MAG TPA: DUF1360 domain-containing protein [Solirubrobacteraceae bacterium]|nr:DUF1360 domain-containing protein [Solirubrobacteraceae bacterium]